MAFEKTHLINLKTADGKTLLIPQIPLRTVVNDGYKLSADGSTLEVTTNLESMKAAIDVQIDGKVTAASSTLNAAIEAADSKIDTTSSALNAAIEAADSKIDTTSSALNAAIEAADSKIDTTSSTLNGAIVAADSKIDAASSTLNDAIVAADSKINAVDAKLTSDYATKLFVGEQIAAIDHLKREIVTELPTGEAIDLNTIYMVKMGDQGENVYREYMYLDGKWEIVGDSNIDFSNYYTKGEVDTTFSSYYTKGEIDTTIGSYYTKGEIDAELADYALTTYVDAQDGSTLTAANEYADAAVSTASSALNAGIVAASSALNASITAVDGKFANYYDKDGIAGLGYATVTQVNTASSAAVTEATGYTDQQLANYLDSTAASQAFILRDEIAAPYSHIVYTSEFGSDTFDLSHASGGAQVTAYTTAGADAKFAPISGAELTDVVSITGENAEIVVSKVTATELQLVNEVQLAGIIIGKDQEGEPLTHITETMANFQNVAVTSDLTVGGSLSVAEVFSATSARIALDADEVAVGETAVFDVANQTVSMGDTLLVDVAGGTVQVYDEWTDGQTTSTGLANVATEHDIAAANAYTDTQVATASSNIMSTINALPGIGDGAILYDVIEEQI